MYNRGPSLTKVGEGYLARHQTVIPVKLPANSTTPVSVAIDLTPASATVFPYLSTLAKVHDKIKWKKLVLTWITAAPTSTGGSVAIYFDMDRKDVGATSITEAMQNKLCALCPIWDKQFSHTIPASMLRSNEWFTTETNASTPGPVQDNTFASPGRVHMVVTPMTASSGTTEVEIGSILVQYEAVFGPPTNSTEAASAPTLFSSRREVPRDTSFLMYNAAHVGLWKHFRAGCVNPIDFWTYMSSLDSQGIPRHQLVKSFEPDYEAILTSDLKRFIIDQYQSPSMAPLPRALKAKDVFPERSDWGVITHAGSPAPAPISTRSIWQYNYGNDTLIEPLIFVRGKLSEISDGATSTMPITTVTGSRFVKFSPQPVSGCPVPFVGDEDLAGAQLDIVSGPVKEIGSYRTDFLEPSGTEGTAGESFRTGGILSGFLERKGNNFEYSNVSGNNAGLCITRFGPAPDVTVSDPQKTAVTYYIFPYAMKSALFGGNTVLAISLLNSIASTTSAYFVSRKGELQIPNLEDPADDGGSEITFPSSAPNTFVTYFNNEITKSYGDDSNPNKNNRNVRIHFIVGQQLDL